MQLLRLNPVYFKLKAVSYSCKNSKKEQKFNLPLTDKVSLIYSLGLTYP